MAPPLSPFLPTSLPDRVQVTPQDTLRKRRVELDKCALRELVQYSCAVEKMGEDDQRGTIVCRPVTRLFRRCADGLTVETTAWEQKSKGEGAG